VGPVICFSGKRKGWKKNKEAPSRGGEEVGFQNENTKVTQPSFVRKRKKQTSVERKDGTREKIIFARDTKNKR